MKVYKNVTSVLQTLVQLQLSLVSDATAATVIL